MCYLYFQNWTFAVFWLHVANILVLGNWASCGGDRRLKWAQSKTNSTWTTTKRVKNIIHYDMPATNRAFSLLGITLRSFRRLLLPANLKNNRYLQRFFHLSRGTWSEFDSIFSGMGLKSYQILIPYVSDYALDSVFRAFVNRWLWMEGSEVAWGSVSWSFWQPFGITCFGISAQTLHNVLLLMNEKHFRTSYISAYHIDIIVLWNINLVGCNIPWVLFLSLKWEKLRSYSRGINILSSGWT